MGKADGFLLYPRKENAWTAPSVRLESYAEFKIPLEQEQRRKQAARCMNCGVPFCQSAIELKGKTTGCPLHNLIPEWNDEIWNRHDRHALSRLLKTNPFPEFTGRVCPALCEKACINGVDGQPVTVHDNELYIIETAWKNGWMETKVPSVYSGRQVAVIGSGPAGLAAAQILNQRGHRVTVFEKADRPGGLLMYGIPNMKLDKDVISRRIGHMEAEGVQFVCGVEAGKDIRMEDLQADFDAVIVCVGAKRPRDLDVPGRDTAGVEFAVDFLTETTKQVVQDIVPMMACDKDVVIVGGGDTGNDCIGTCLRQNAKSITAVEMMPKAPDVRRADNPWPEWPDVNKTDYGHEEARTVYGKDPRVYETTVREIHSDNGHITAVTLQKVRMEGRQMVLVEGTEQTIPCQLLLIAAGFTGIEDGTRESLNLQTTPRNTIASKAGSYQTDQAMVFAAGDARRGQSLVVWAIHEGMEAAREVDEALMGYTNIER